MPARQAWLLFVVGICTPAGAEPHKPPRDLVVARESLLAAASRVGARYGLVTSTFRTIEHNRAVGGVPDSYHLLGRAIDIVRRPGVSHAQIAAALIAAGFHLIESLDEGTHSHFAFVGRPKVTPVIPPPRALPPKTVLAADQHGMLRLDADGRAANGHVNEFRGNQRNNIH